MTVFLCSKAPKRCEENVVECIRLTQIAHDDLKIQFLKIQIEPYSVSLEGSSYQESTVCLT